MKKLSKKLNGLRHKLNLKKVKYKKHKRLSNYFKELFSNNKTSMSKI